MKHQLYLFFLLVVGVINFIPVVGLFSANQLAIVYGVDLNSQELILLMRHRALLFGLLGGLVLYSLFKPRLRPTAMVIAGISMLGFVFLAWPIGDLNDPMSRVFMMDVLAMLCLLLAVLCHWLDAKSGARGGR